MYSTNGKLSPPAAENIIVSLRAGTPNINSIIHINVDIEARKAWLDDVKRDLDKYIMNGYSKVRFIKGDYGVGKTHSMSLIMHYARENNYAVSYISADQVRLNRYDEIFSAIVRNLEIKGRKENTLKFLLENFVNKTRRELESRHGLNDQDFIVSETKKRISEFIEQMQKTTYDFKNAMLNYMFNFLEMPSGKDWQTDNENVLRWFSGMKVPLKELKELRIYSLNDKDNSRDSIKSLADIIVNFGFKGMLIVIDEAEQVLYQSTNAAKMANNNIRHILDSVDGGGETHYAERCYILVASTAEMMSNPEKGFKSYTALWDRIGSVLNEPQFAEFINPRSIIIDLDHQKAKVTQADLKKIIDNIIRIHAIAYEWEPGRVINEKIIEGITKKAFDLLKRNTPLRASVKMIIEILDLTNNDNSFIKKFDPSGYVFKPERQNYSKWDD